MSEPRRGPGEGAGRKPKRWLGREQRRLALELPHALYAMELLLAGGCGPEEAIVHVAEHDYGPVSRHFARALDVSRAGSATLTEALLAGARESGSRPFDEAVRELVARMESGWDLGKRLGHYALRNQIALRRANDNFSRNFRGFYIHLYLTFALLFPFLFAVVERFTGAMPGAVIDFQDWIYLLLAFTGLGLGSYLIWLSPPLERITIPELCRYLLHNPSPRWVAGLGLGAAGLLGLQLVGRADAGWGPGLIMLLIFNPFSLLLLLLVADYFAHAAVERLERRFHEGLEQAADLVAQSQSLESALNEALGREFLLDLGLVRDTYELADGCDALARRYPFRSFQRTAEVLRLVRDRGLEAGEALERLAQGLWTHHLIKYRRQQQNTRDLLFAGVVMGAVVLFFLPPPAIFLTVASFLLVYLVGVGRL